MTKMVSRAKAWWVPGALVLGCLIISYWEIIQVMVRQWINDLDYSGGLLVVPMAGYLAWQRRTDLREATIRTDWWALVLLSLAVFVFVVGELGAELFTTRVSMLLFVAGLTWFLYGFEVFKILLFPLAFLFLMLPLPGFIYRNITFPLQLSASTGAVHLLHALGISAYREGNIIDIGFMQLQVVEACSGIRYILPLLTFVIFLACLRQRSVWKRVTLMLATVPVAVLANMLRVGGTGYIALHWGNEAAEGFFHNFSGWIVFMVCVLFFLILNAVVNHLRARPAAEKPPPAKPPTQRAWQGLQWSPVLAAILLILGTPTLVNHLGRVPPVPLRRPLQAFPTSLENMTGKRSKMDVKIWDRVGGQDYVIIDYYDEGNDSINPINFYVAYYELQKKAGEFVHSPRLCLPGSGWFIEKNHVRRLPRKTNPHPSSESLMLKELLTSKDGMRQLVYFWYQGRGRNFTNEFAAKFWMVWDGIWRRRTDGALVRLITPLRDGESIEMARSVMDPFALRVSAMLEEYLP